VNERGLGGRMNTTVKRGGGRESGDSWALWRVIVLDDGELEDLVEYLVGETENWRGFYGGLVRSWTRGLVDSTVSRWL
jgi:hypothetical protein